MPAPDPSRGAHAALRLTMNFLERFTKQERKRISGFAYTFRMVKNQLASKDSEASQELLVRQALEYFDDPGLQATRKMDPISKIQRAAVRLREIGLSRAEFEELIRAQVSIWPTIVTSISGKDFMARLRQMAGKANVQVISLNGLSDDEIAELAKSGALPAGQSEGP